MATFVLVHGAWHGGWGWKKVTPLLRAAGHDVYTPTLTGLGERVHLLTPAVNLSTQVQDIVNVLVYEDLHNVVLVGWSHGGMVISGVAEAAAERISRLVYVDAFLPDPGESAFSIAPFIRDWWERDSHETNGVQVQQPWNLEQLRSQGITDPDDLAWIEQRMTPQPLVTWAEPLPLPEHRATLLPRSYIWCAEVPETRFQFEKAKALGLDCHELPSGHLPMYTAPRELAALLSKIAEEMAPPVRNTAQ
jgi:pimeloyl-ACP methyl ester carboxylesterase